MGKNGIQYAVKCLVNMILVDTI